MLWPLLLRRVTGDSMAPTLRPGQIVLVNCWARRLRIGDIVMVRHADLEKVKRVSNVHEDQIYLLGDNPARSTDSRQFGWLPKRSLIGRVVWPKL